MIILHFRASPRSFVELRPTQQVLMRGPYAFSRNPMYLSELVVWLGWAHFYGSLTVFAGFLAWLALFNLVVVPWEERRLEARFGETYRAYRVRVPRWLGLSFRLTA
jgi:protein-S-isoprenylcysteine O-methyltransferase Ste14